MKIVLHGLITSILLIPSFLFAQEKEYPQDYFRSPLDIPLYLAGNFGELRSNHFHAGLDMKTNQVEGLPIYATAEGYVSRIKISLYGYGKVLYVKHPNGYTTVYAHLQRFNDKIESYVRDRQYAKQAFEIEIFPGPGDLPVTKSEVIARSGNTGGSGGPHLHFEIRDSGTEIPINPLLFGFDVKDTRSPVLKTVSIYPLNDTSTVNGKPEPLHLALRGADGRYTIPGMRSLRARGVIGFGIETVDYFNGSSNRCGAYEIELFADGNRIYSHRMEEIPFALSRYINSHLDYGESKRSRKRIQRSFLEPNNRLSIYDGVVRNGKVFFSQFGHDLQYHVKDQAGNTSTLAFSVNLDTVRFVPDNSPKSGTHFPYNEVNTFKQDEVQITIPAFALYDDLLFTYARKPGTAKTLGPVYVLGSRETPLHNYATVSITLDSVPEKYRAKIVAVSLTEKGNLLSSEGGKLTGNKLTFRTRSLGPYSVMIDTIAPRIVARDLRAASTMQQGQRLVFRISDKLSGISTYTGKIDDQWVLVEYDRKTGDIWYEHDPKRVPSGKHRFTFTVTDKVGNQQVYTTSIQTN